MKQSLQNWLPVIDDAVPFAQLLADVKETQRFVAHLPVREPPVHLAKAALPGGGYAVLIGPEGDFFGSGINSGHQCRLYNSNAGSKPAPHRNGGSVGLPDIDFSESMKRLIALFLLTLCCGLTTLRAQYAYKIAKLKYNGGGDWYANKTSLPNLIKFANANLRMNIFPEEDIVEAGSPDIFSYPFVHVTGHGNIVFTDTEVQNMRRYLLSGGFLHVDDNYGLDKFIRREMKKSFFPNCRLSSCRLTTRSITRSFRLPMGCLRFTSTTARLRRDLA